MGWTATILVPHRVDLASRTQAEAITVASQIASQYEKVGEHGAKVLEINRARPEKWIPDELPPPPMAA